MSTLTEILDWRVHLGHSHHVGNCTFRCNDATKCVGVFLTKLFEKNQTKFAQELVLTALLDDNSQTTGQISSLLADLGTLVV